MKVKTRRAGGEVAVSLLAPDEPLAWAIAAPFAGDGPFRTQWHAERTPGTRPVPAPREGRVAYDGHEPLGVRVFGDDGSVGMAVVRP